MFRLRLNCWVFYLRNGFSSWGPLSLWQYYLLIIRVTMFVSTWIRILYIVIFELLIYIFVKHPRTPTWNESLCLLSRPKNNGKKKRFRICCIPIIVVETKFQTGMCFKDSWINVYSQFTAIQLYSYLQYAITNTIMKVEIKFGFTPLCLNYYL
jgi:hypothetical protein